MADDLTTFIELFRPEYPLHLIAIEPDKGPRGWMTFDDDRAGAVEWARSRNRTCGLYFTPNLVREGFTGKPSKADLKGFIGVWSDCDPRRDLPFSEEHERLMRLGDEIQGIPWPPSVTVNSGGGIQPSWLLEDPIEALPEWRVKVEHLCARIEASLGAAGTHNVDRVLRLPGTINHPNALKRKAGRSAVPAAIVHATWRRYSWRDLEALAHWLETNDLKHAVRREPAEEKPDSSQATDDPLFEDVKVSEERGRAFLDGEMLKVLLHNFPEFAAMWNRQATPRHDSTVSGYMLAVGSMLHRRGLTNLQTLADAMSAFALKEDNPKADDRREVLRKLALILMDAGRKWENASKEDVEAAEAVKGAATAAPSSKIEALRVALKVNLTRVIANGDDPAAFWMECEEYPEPIFLGSISDLYSLDRMRSTIKEKLRVGASIPPYKKVEWLKIIDVFVAVAELEEAEYDFRHELNAVAIEFVLNKAGKEGRTPLVIKERSPFVDDTHIGLTAAAFHQSMNGHASYRGLTLTDTVQYLKKAGWIRRTYNGPGSTTRSYYVLPKGKAI